MKKAFYVILVLLLVSVAGNVWQYDVKKQKQADEATTTIQVDTVRYSVATYTYDTLLRHEVVTLPVVRKADTTHTKVVLHDTVQMHDSIDVEIPITQRRYDGDTYRAWVSGFRPNLDSIEVYNTTTTIKQPAPKRKRWGLGVQAGYGYGKNGMQPYVGVGVSYNFVVF